MIVHLSGKLIFKEPSYAIIDVKGVGYKVNISLNTFNTLPNIDKCKYLVPRDMNLGQFIYIIRKRIQLESHQALFVTVNGVLGSSSTVISELYDNNKDEDGFLYVVYTSENTFG